MKICRNCVLPENFPGINLDTVGVCSWCREAAPASESEEQKKMYFSRFRDLINNNSGKSEYDCMLAYSGGKDSSYTLYVLKEEFGVDVLALTMDNSFVSKQALDNITAVTAALGVDSLVVKPDFNIMKKIFANAALNTMYPRKTLERASEICTSCIALVKFIFLKTALEKGVPLLAWGWSPGQAPVRSSIMKMNPSFFRNAQKQLLGPIEAAAGPEVRKYFLSEKHFAMDFPVSVSPLAFMEYSEKKINRTLEGIGWRPPQDVDGNSTNCLLNALANRVHIEKHGFHPYAFEIASMVRSGIMSREEGLEKLEKAGDESSVTDARKKLGLEV